MRALIIGVSGQDGAYLARLLLEKGYQVHGSSRDPARASLVNLERLGLRDRVRLHGVDPADLPALRAALEEIQPDEVYHLSGQSSVGLSFERPVEAVESIAGGTLHVLEAVRLAGRPVRLCCAGSGEAFGETGGRAADEETPFRPRSPYAAAKAAAFWQVATYREAYRLFAVSALLFNHESPLRPERFVTRKIVAAACRIAAGSGERLRLGNLEVWRDWGWAPEYVEGMWRMLQHPAPEDFVLATGQLRALRNFVEEAFAAAGLRAADHVESDPTLFRPTDLRALHGNPAKAERLLGWRAAVHLPEVARRMVAAERGGSPG